MGKLVINKDECNKMEEMGIQTNWNPDLKSCEIEFTNANIAGSTFEDAQMQLSDFRKADMTDSLFRNSKINEAQKNKINWM